MSEPVISITVNDESHHLRVKANWTLLWVLRERLGLKGAKLACNTGSCGACKVIVDGTAVASCRVLASKIDGKRITTIEGLSSNGILHPLQEAFIEHGAFQCGFCAPGMILVAKVLLDNNPNPNESEVRRALRHNLCRCGSYAKQVAAVIAAAKTIQMGDHQ